ncbi:hypothetical protein EJB05_40990, partial [Eragrostis curvula]
MASLGRLVLLAGLAFLVLNAQNAHGAAEATTTAAAEVAVVQVPESTGGPPASPASVEVSMQQKPIPPSGPSDNFNYMINHVNMSSAHAAGPPAPEES